MEKILAIVIFIVVVWWAYPFVSHGVFLAPTPVDPNSWLASDDISGVAQASAALPQGYGFFHFDFWNHPSDQGRPVTKSDWKLRR